MKFHEREYYVYALFVGPEGPQPWLFSTWQSISEATSSVYAAARDRPAGRSTQFSGTAPQMRQIPFGRIAHNAKGAAKWTHERDGQLLSGDQAHFADSEVWAPSWNACERDGKAPDVYLCTSNRLGWVPNVHRGKPQFAAICIFAFANDLGPEIRSDGRRAAELLSALLSSPLGFVGVRPWGRASGAGFTDAINDLHLVEPFRPPVLDQDDPSLAQLKGNWASFRNTLV